MCNRYIDHLQGIQHPTSPPTGTRVCRKDTMEEHCGSSSHDSVVHEDIIEVYMDDTCTYKVRHGV